MLWKIKHDALQLLLEYLYTLVFDLNNSLLMKTTLNKQKAFTKLLLAFLPALVR